MKVRIDRIDVRESGAFSVFIGNEEFQYNGVDEAVGSSGNIGELMRRILLIDAKLACPAMTVEDLPGFVGKFVELDTAPTPAGARIIIGKDDV